MCHCNPSIDGAHKVFLFSVSYLTVLSLFFFFLENDMVKQDRDGARRNGSGKGKDGDDDDGGEDRLREARMKQAS